MKRQIAVILIILAVIQLSACQSNPPAAQGAAFYYCSADLTYNMDSVTILAEYHKGIESDSLQQMLDKYFSGPASETLRSPFPAGLQLMEVKMDKNTVYVTVNNALAKISGLELTLACSCITLTCLDFSGADQVVISAQNALLDGQKSITMDQNTILLLDTVLEGE